MVALGVETGVDEEEKKNGLTTGGVNNTVKYFRAGPLPLPC